MYSLAGTILLCAALPLGAQNDWPTFGHDLAGTRYSPLKDITPANVGKLTRAWTYHMKTGGPAVVAADDGHEPAPAAGRGGRGRGGRGGGGRGGAGGFSPTSEVSPLMINGVLYIITAYGKVAALEPATGKELWTFQLPDGSPA